MLLIGLGAVGLRFVGLSWGLPYELHPDEAVILARVATMSWSNMNPGFFMYPGLFIYQIFFLDRIVTAFGGETQHLIHAARLLTATYGLATVGFVYLLGARLGGRRLGTIGAALTALTGALTLHAHYAVTDTPATALATATLWLSVRAWQRRSYGGIVAAAVIAGLAVSTKYSVAPVCFVPWLGFMALALRDRMPLARRASGTAILAAVSVAAFLLTSPFTLLDYEGFLDDLAVESHLQARARAGFHVDPLEDPAWTDRAVVDNTVAAFEDLGPMAIVLALAAILYLLGASIGVVRGLKKHDSAAHSVSGPEPHRLARDGETTTARADVSRDPPPPGAGQPDPLPDLLGGLLVVAWVVLYFAFMAPSALGGQRYLVPIYPAMMLLAAAAIDGLLRAFQRSERPVWISVAGGVALLSIVAVPPLMGAVSSTRLLAQPDTRLVAREWIVANLEQRSHLAREFYSPPIHTSDNFRLSQPFSLTEHPLETYCKESVDFLILSSLNAERYFESGAERFAEERAWYDRIDSRTRIVHRIEGKGGMKLHHPTIEIRRLFCG